MTSNETRLSKPVPIVNKFKNIRIYIFKIKYVVVWCKLLNKLDVRKSVDEKFAFSTKLNNVHHNIIPEMRIRNSLSNMKQVVHCVTVNSVLLHWLEGAIKDFWALKGTSCVDTQLYKCKSKSISTNWKDKKIIFLHSKLNRNPTNH